MLLHERSDTLYIYAVTQLSTVVEEPELRIISY